MPEVKILYIQSSELTTLRKHQVRQDRGFAYDPNIATAMYESVASLMNRLDSDIAYLNMEKAALFLPCESKPIKDDWGKAKIYGYSCSIFSGIFNRNEHLLISFGDVKMFVFYAEIKTFNTQKKALEFIDVLAENSRLAFSKRLLAGERSGYIKNKNYLINGTLTQEYLSRYPHICRRGITVLNKGFNLGFESLIDRNPVQCFQEHFNFQKCEVQASA